MLLTDQLANRLVAHRGYSERYPENTLLAVKEAIKAGARFIEVDIQLSADLEPVLFHDRDLNRLCRQSGTIYDYSLAGLQTFHPSNPDKFADQFSSVVIPHLRQLVEVLQAHPAVTAFIELKRITINHFGAQSMAEKVLPELAPVKSQCVIISYSIPGLQCVRKNGWQKVGAVIDDWADRKREDIVELAPEYLFFDHSSLPEKLDCTQKLAFNKSSLAVFECSDPQRARELMACGIELVETNNIANLINTIEE